MYVYIYICLYVYVSTPISVSMPVSIHIMSMSVSMTLYIHVSICIYNNSVLVCGSRCGRRQYRLTPQGSKSKTHRGTLWGHRCPMCRLLEPVAGALIKPMTGSQSAAQQRTHRLTNSHDRPYNLQLGDL